jgi:hypothetical protein
MQTGIKQLDKVIAKRGITTEPTHNEFQSSMRLFGKDNRLKTLNLPPCMANIVCNLKDGESVTLHRFYLAYKENSPRLAFFLTDEDGRIVERVYFLRKTLYQHASANIGKLLRQQEAIAA